MAVLRNQVAAYRVHFYGCSQSVKDPAVADKRAEIFLISTEQQQLGPLVGTLSFYSPEVAATKQSGLDQNGRPEAHFSMTEIGAILDLLRHEKPICVMWDDERNLLWLATGAEPVGENEDD